MRCERQDFARAIVAQGDRALSVGNCVLSAIVALVVAFPSLAASLPNVGGHLALISNAVDRTHKSDRIIPATATFAARWDNGSAGKIWIPRSERSARRQFKAKIPIGCDRAFDPWCLLISAPVAS